MINHNDKFIGIVGARGVGKTTYILQYLSSVISDEWIVLSRILEN